MPIKRSSGGTARPLAVRGQQEEIALARRSRSEALLLAVRRLDVLPTALLMVDDRVMHGGEEARAPQPVATDVAQRVVGHGGQRYLVAVDRQGLEQLAQ